MVVKKMKSPKASDANTAVSKKRQSMNGSGVWEVETITITPKQPPAKLENQSFKSPRFARKGSRFSPYEPKGHGSPAPRGHTPTTPTEHGPTASTQDGPTASTQDGSTASTEHAPTDQTEDSLSFTPKNQIKFTPLMPKRQWKEPPKNVCHGWTNNDLLQLVSRVEDNCAEYFSLEYYEGLKKVDWTKISFEEHTAEECERVWNYIFSKARTPRELLQEARKLLLGKRPRAAEFMETQNVSQNSSVNDNGNLANEKEDANGVGALACKDTKEATNGSGALADDNAEEEEDEDMEGSEGDEPEGVFEDDDDDDDEEEVEEESNDSEEEEEEDDDDNGSEAD